MTTARTLLVIAATLSLVGTATTGTAADPVLSAADDGAIEALTAFNEYRADAGLPPLVVDLALEGYAQGWAAQSAVSGVAGPNPDVADDVAPWLVQAELYATGSAAGGAAHLVDFLADQVPGIVYRSGVARVGVGYATSAGGAGYLYVVLADDPYHDVVVGDAFADDIFWLTSAGVTTGWPDGSFRPTAPVTREAMAAFLYRLRAADPSLPTCDPVAAPPFLDVGPGHPFCGAIAWLADEGISTGHPDGTFRPGQSVTREAMAAFLYRWWKAWAGSSAPMPACDPAGARTFVDVRADHPFCGAIEWLAARDVTKGWPDGTFRPAQPIERQAMAAFLHRFDAFL